MGMEAPLRKAPSVPSAIHSTSHLSAYLRARARGGGVGGGEAGRAHVVPASCAATRAHVAGCPALRSVVCRPNALTTHKNALTTYTHAQPT